MMDPLGLYDTAPHDPRNVLKAAILSIDRGMNETAFMLADKGLSLTKNDMMKTAFREIQSYAGYYSKIKKRRVIGRTICEQLSISHTISSKMRDVARMNLAFSSPRLKDMIQPMVTSKLEIDLPTGFVPGTVSVASDGNELYALVQALNLGPEREQAESVHVKHYLLELDQTTFGVKDSTEIMSHSVAEIFRMPWATGMVDARLFFMQGEPWCIASSTDFNNEAWSESVMARISNLGHEIRFTDGRRLVPEFRKGKHERHWMPAMAYDGLKVVCDLNPVTVVDHECNMVATNECDSPGDNWAGGSQLIQFNGGYLGIIHDMITCTDDKKRCLHRFAWFDKAFNLRMLSHSFHFSRNDVPELASGLCWHQNKKDLIISFSVADAESHVAMLNASAVSDILIPTRVLTCTKDTDTSKIGLTTTRMIDKNASRPNLSTIISPPRIVKTRPNVALMFAGLPRLKRKSISFWQEFVSEHRPMVFVHSWETGDSDNRAALDEIRKLFDPKVFLIDKTGVFDTRPYEDRKMPGINVFNTLSMWTSISRCFKGMADFYEPFGSKPDVVVRSRFDLHVDEKLDLLDVPSMVVPMEPFKQPSCFHYRKQFIVSQQDVLNYGPFDQMAGYCDLISQIPRIMQEEPSLLFVSEYLSAVNLWERQIGYYTPTLPFHLVR